MWRCGSENCYTTMVGNGQCDAICNVEACSWDGGDCHTRPPTTTSTQRPRPVVTTTTPQPRPRPSTPAPCGCAAAWLGDGVCDSYCNTAECDYDAGDCKSPTTTTLLATTTVAVAQPPHQAEHSPAVSTSTTAASPSNLRGADKGTAEPMGGDIRPDG